MKIKTALIPAGGWGTRFLPSTKSIPKEMFPLGNKPVILHVVEEAVASGIENIIFVVSHHKQSIESFFSPNEILEDYFLKRGKKEQVAELQKIASMANFDFVYVKNLEGNGGALEAGRHLLLNDPFVLVWSDEIIFSKKEPRIKQCLDAFYKYGKPVISAVEIKDKNKRQRYGMAELKDIPGEKEIKEIIQIIEKPEPGEEPSVYATHGAYVLTPEVFEALDQTKAGRNGELWLVDIINRMKEKTGLLAKIIPDGHYLDCGDPSEYLYSQIEYFINYTEFSKEVRSNIKKIL
jgi:UTP--glucose-1-phosphate uridylyltransferase